MYKLFASSSCELGFLIIVIEPKFVNLLISKSLSWTLKTVELSRLLLMFWDDESISALVGITTFVSGEAKLVLRDIESC